MKTEFEFINNLIKRTKIQNPKSKIAASIGDDCAVVRQNSKTDLVITTDLLVEDIDFRHDWIAQNPALLGHKALAVSLSDIAAMGATPSFALVSIGVPDEIWASGFVEKFYDGWFQLANKFNVSLIGGDVSRTPDKIVIDSIVAGEVKKNRAVLRSTAKIGDLLFVTGKLGGASAGLQLLENGIRLANAAHQWQKELLLKQLTPSPQINIGKTLSRKHLATAMIDISDGLSSDLAHLCAASNVGAIIYAEKIPLDENLKNLTADFDEQLNFALHGGEDFQLLFTAAPKNAKTAARFAAHIGEITAPDTGISLVHPDETISPLKNAGFRHF